MENVLLLHLNEDKPPYGWKNRFILPLVKSKTTKSRRKWKFSSKTADKTGVPDGFGRRILRKVVGSADFFDNNNGLLPYETLFWNQNEIKRRRKQMKLAKPADFWPRRGLQPPKMPVQA